jgi:hypothetical protein
MHHPIARQIILHNRECPLPQNMLIVMYEKRINVITAQEIHMT